jgi:hypothetical protein
VIDPNSRQDRDLKAAEEFFGVGQDRILPFMRAYYQRVAERDLSSEREVRSLKRHDDTAATIEGTRSSRPE